MVDAPNGHEGGGDTNMGEKRDDNDMDMDNLGNQVNNGNRSANNQAKSLLLIRATLEVLVNRLMKFLSFSLGLLCAMQKVSVMTLLVYLAILFSFIHAA